MHNLSVYQKVFLLLGSNLGERLQILQSAAGMVEERVGTIRAASSIYETAPWGVLDQPVFLNQILEVQTELMPEEVLRIILEIEHELGRIRYERWGARVIDIDILYFNDLVQDSARLTLPHPRLHERRFTLIPLTEIAPDFLHPLLQKTSLELLADCDDPGAVIKIS
ncbi:2-amino-4-hydroxy-6-hydroxymethyldihydropteridine diphosphokinase [Dyadobacter sp. CY345]|uniref:2-amino-4-hydroxy-6- hydroxymethyldihydropteridine diphosphokinase n=1 Tax=Dyadobacter sp. CY345 TaxID=2909335 RepID=UPI001F3A05C4|nr:2-amino-4-hydroxy-6-hydroxymethyldihydropteridine diphosphokinase [Dyadobacter sp. CY345]MCF2445240.1 2-amino-4-hydroxy-6-hydroxymethyldihydropteridine diphosphokinase [Dyadobacter sp. CY345]